jgi:hypothetical protein
VWSNETWPLDDIKPRSSILKQSTFPNKITVFTADIHGLISGFRREVDENCALLGHYTASSGNFLPTFRDYLLGLVFRDQDPWLPKMGPTGCPETWVRNYHYSQRNNIEERSSQCGLISDDTLPRMIWDGHRLHEARNWKAVTVSCWLSPGNYDGILGRPLFRGLSGASNLTTVSKKQGTTCVII